MNPEERAAAVARCAVLREQLRRWNKAYYQESKMLVADAEFDRCMRELQELEKQYGLRQPDSPSVRVGGGLDRRFNTVPHGVSMLSLETAASRKRMQQFDKSLRERLPRGDPEFAAELAYAAEPKIDGVALNLCYRDGVLEYAATRGDGVLGEDVSANAGNISGVCARLEGREAPRRVEVRGEVCLGRGAFEELNRQRRARGAKLFLNPRNVASGGLRQQDPSNTRKRRLSFVAHGIGLLEGFPVPGRYSKVIDLLVAWGFSVSPQYRQVRGVDGCEAYYRELEARREDLDFEMDGAVFKLERRDCWNRIGSHAKAPRWAIAWKFPPREVMTEVLGIDIQVGRTGMLTPMARLRPVEVGGVWISNATLHNRSELQRKDVRVGDTVWLHRAGDVIPAVVRVCKERRPGHSRSFSFPKRCPICDSALNPPDKQPDGNYTARRRSIPSALKSPDKQRDGNQERCQNPACPAQRCGRIVHFASRHALDIQGFGVKLVQRLVDEGLLREPLDLFRLKVAELERMDGLGELSGRRLQEALRQARETTLARLLYALGIPEVGVEMARRLAGFFGSLRCLAAARPETLMYLEGVGPRLARSIHDFFREHGDPEGDPGETRPSLENRLWDAGLTWPERPAVLSSRIHRLEEFNAWLQLLHEDARSRCAKPAGKPKQDKPDEESKQDKSDEESKKGKPAGKPRQGKPAGKPRQGQSAGKPTWGKPHGETLQAALRRWQNRMGSLLELADEPLKELLYASAAKPVTAEKMFAFLREPGLRESLGQLRELGLDWEGGVLQGALDLGQDEAGVLRHAGRLAGKTLVLSGSLPGLPREEAERRILAVGGRIGAGVSRATDYIVVGERPGGKLSRAEALGIPRLGAAELLELLAD